MLETILANADKFTPFVILLLIAYAGYKEAWLWGWVHRSIVADKDAQIVVLNQEKEHLLDLLLESVNVAERNGTVARGALTLAQKKKGGDT